VLPPGERSGVGGAVADEPSLEAHHSMGGCRDGSHSLGGMELPERPRRADANRGCPASPAARTQIRPATFASAIAAGLLSVVALTGLWIVFSQIGNGVGNRLPDFSKYPTLTVALSLAMAAIMRAGTEEAGFRGYLQGTLERRFGAGVAILFASLASRRLTVLRRALRGRRSCSIYWPTAHSARWRDSRSRSCPESWCTRSACLPSSRSSGHMTPPDAWCAQRGPMHGSGSSGAGAHLRRPRAARVHSARAIAPSRRDRLTLAPPRRASRVCARNRFSSQ
jgi:hypothetical protein